MCRPGAVGEGEVIDLPELVSGGPDRKRNGVCGDAERLQFAGNHGDQALDLDVTPGRHRWLRRRPRLRHARDRGLASGIRLLSLSDRALDDRGHAQPAFEIHTGERGLEASLEPASFPLGNLPDRVLDEAANPVAAVAGLVLTQQLVPGALGTEPLDLRRELRGQRALAGGLERQLADRAVGVAEGARGGVDLGTHRGRLLAPRDCRLTRRLPARARAVRVQVGDLELVRGAVPCRRQLPTGCQAPCRRRCHPGTCRCGTPTTNARSLHVAHTSAGAE